jgi:ribosomal protein S12 methylthiotransferase
MELQREISQQINESFIGKTIRVLIDEKEAAEEGVYNGRSEGDAPDVDCQVIVHSAAPLEPGRFVDVKITDAMEYDLVGSAV